MLARSGQLPHQDGYAFELKWDGFGIARSGREFRVRSRRGWNMTALLPELATLPVEAVLDGELVAPGEDGWPDFPLVCDRFLKGKATIPLLVRNLNYPNFTNEGARHDPSTVRCTLRRAELVHTPGR
jgi:ATP-dependent DNA ligase